MSTNLAAQLLPRVTQPRMRDQQHQQNALQSKLKSIFFSSPNFVVTKEDLNACTISDASHAGHRKHLLAMLKKNQFYFE